MRIFFLLLVTMASQAQSFLGETLTGNDAEIFSTPVISSTLYERDFAISPDGREVFYSLVFGPNSARIVSRKFQDGKWSLPQALSFSSGSNDIEPALSPDGKRLFFASNRGGNFDIFVSDRKDDGTWSAPLNVGGPINTEGNEFYPSVTDDGTLYYTARYASGAIGGEDIWYSKLEGGNYQTPVVLPGPINTIKDEYNAFIDPKGNYILFGSFGRTDDVGRGDIYICRKSANGNWQSVVHLARNVNSEQLDYCPYVSPDGRYLFFTSERSVPTARATHPFKPLEIMKGISTTQGGGNIFWTKFN